MSKKVLLDARKHEQRHFATAKEIESLRTQINGILKEKDE